MPDMSNPIRLADRLASYRYDYVYQRFQEQLDMEIDATQFQQGQVADQLAGMYRLIRELALTLDVTMDMLAKAGHLDIAAISDRVQTELANPASPPVACIQCGKTVPGSNATVTAFGPVCRPCGGATPA